MMCTARGSVRMGDSLEAMERDPELERTGEGEEGLKRRSPAEVREDGPGEWDLTYGQWVTDVCLTHSGVWRGTPALGGPSRSGQKRQGGCVQVFCAWGEGENSATCHCSTLTEHAPRCTHCFWGV